MNAHLARLRYGCECAVASLHEGGSQLAESYPESLGITRQLTETYRVGGYAYTNLADATAQARRMQKQESGR